MLRAAIQKLKGSARSLFVLAPPAGLLLYLTTLAILYFVQDQLVFPHSPPDQDSVQWLKVHEPGSAITFKDEGALLQGWHLHAATGKPVIFYFNGNAGDVATAARQFSPLQEFQSVFVNYRGYGASTGTPSEQALYRDALKIFDATVQNYHPSRVVVMGRSLGTGVATYLASQRKIDALVLITPYDSLVAIGQARYPYAPTGWLMRDKFDSLSRAGSLTAPTLVLIAENDVVIPRANTERLLEKLPQLHEAKILNGTNHGTIVESPEYLPTIKQFLQHLSSQQP